MMPPRLFLGNFDFEHRLADPRRQLSAKLERINAELALSWLAIAADGDFIWTPQAIDPNFFERAAIAGLPRVVAVESLAAVPPQVECVPWGWTDAIRQLCDQHGWIHHDPPHPAVRATNSRRFSSTLELEWQVGLDGSGPAASWDDVERLIAQYIAAHGNAARWVIKAEFGMSGRERILGCGGVTAAQRRWIDSRLSRGEVVFFEPWIERLAEVGIQIDVPRNGAPQLVGVVPLLSDEQGQYCGSWFAPVENDDASHPAVAWDAAVSMALRAAERVQEHGYFGPLGIDAMRYLAADGSIRVRPLQDINARWTMGRLSLGWRRFLHPGEAGCWRHGRSGLHSVTTDGRTISTSPSLIGGIPSSRESFVWMTSLK